MIRTLHCMNIFRDYACASEGDVIELGVARGDTAFPLAGLMSELTPSKTLFACDTFKGLPYDDSIESSMMCKKGEMNHGNVFKKILDARNDSNIVVLKGLIENTLEAHLKDTVFCFAWIDLDLFNPTLYSYQFLENKISKGGVIGFHDYMFIRCPGVEKVVRGYLDKTKFTQIADINTCIFFRRN